MNRSLSLPAIAAAFVFGAATSAQALNQRTWISATGVDQGGCGPIASPCRTLQYAHDNTAAAGEIDVKDSGGYGAVVITKGITIIGDGSLAGVLATPGGNAIEIDAGSSDTIILRGLTIEGAGAGSNGIVLNSGGKIDISNCFITRFVGSFEKGNGILIAPPSGAMIVTISNTTSSYNGYSGINHYPPGSSTGSLSLVIDDVTATNNLWANVSLFSSYSSGSTTATLMNSTFAKGNSGVILQGNNLRVIVDNCHADNNASLGIAVYLSPPVAITRTSASNNGSYGVEGGTNVVSYKDNRFFNNVSGPSSGIGSATLN